MAKVETILNAFYEFDRESIRINNDIVHKLDQNIPPVIYHYTNDIGLRGILETGKLWLTDVFALNDPSEIIHGLSYFIKALDAKIANGHPEGKSIYEFFEVCMQKKILPLIFFVCSFSSAGNELGQWRAYADNGRGFSMGFDTKILEKAFEKDIVTPGHGSMNATFPVTYNDRKLAKIQRDLVIRLFLINPFPSKEDLGEDAFKDKLLYSLGYSSLYPTMFFKHGAYKNEKEYRFLQIHAANSTPIVNYRSRSYSLIKYREFDWRSLAAKALKKIVIGPAADKEKVSQFTRDCFQEAGIDAVELEESKIPYRSL
jgi:hypothetical protein